MLLALAVACLCLSAVLFALAAAYWAMAEGIPVLHSPQGSDDNPEVGRRIRYLTVAALICACVSAVAFAL
jgi:hypothetical protein